MPPKVRDLERTLAQAGFVKPSHTKRKSLRKPSRRRAPDAREYQLVIRYSHEDQCYLAHAPAFPGCITHGETAEVAARRGLEALQLWLDDAAAKGDSIPPPPTGSSGKMTLRLPPSLHAKVAQAAELDGVSINQWITTKLAQEL